MDLRLRTQASRRNGLSNTLTAITRSILPVLAVLIAAGAGNAQQVLEIDYESGRTVIDSEERAIYSTVIDHERSILYAYDLEEPEGVMAFSLVTGEWMRTVRFQTGGGPQELPQGFAGMAVAPGGGLYVSDLSRVLEFDGEGRYVGNWTPHAPERKGAVCDFNGEPAVPTFNGVIKRNGDSEVTIGPGPSGLSHLSEHERRQAADRIWSARMACTAAAAFVVTTYADDTDSLTAYYGSGRMGMLPIPAELAEAAKATVGPKIGTDGQGDIVLSAIADIRLGGHGGYLVAGAVIDPATGCYATIRNPEKNMFAYEFRGVYADSAVVAVAAYEEGQELGRRVIDYYDYADKVALYPLRRVNGEPCAGMLTTVS